MDTAEHSTPVPTTPVPAVTELQPYRVEAAVRLLREQDVGRAAIAIGEYVRLFQAPELGRGVFVQYFWHTLEEMDQCLTPLCAFFGDKLRRAISPDELAEYVAQRRSIGVTNKAILQELSCLDAAVRHRCGRSRAGRTLGFSLPSRRFLKGLPPKGNLAPPAVETAMGEQDVTIAEAAAAVRAWAAQSVMSRVDFDGFKHVVLPPGLPPGVAIGVCSPEIQALYAEAWREAEGCCRSQNRGMYGVEANRGELLRRIVALAQAGLAARDIAKQLGVHPHAVWRRLREARLTLLNHGQLHNAKLTESDVVTIREDRRRGVTTRELAQRYGVKMNAITSCLGGRTWGHVPGALSPAEVRAKRSTGE